MLFLTSALLLFVMASAIRSNSQHRNQHIAHSRAAVVKFSPCCCFSRFVRVDFVSSRVCLPSWGLLLDFARSISVKTHSHRNNVWDQGEQNDWTCTFQTTLKALLGSLPKTYVMDKLRSTFRDLRFNFLEEIQLFI